MTKRKVGLPRAKVVIIEDDAALRESLEKNLARRFDVTALSSGEDDIVGLVDSVAPDILVLDVNLPGPDGFELCRRIRGGAESKEIPVIFMTARSDDESFVKSLDVGGSSYIAKPFRVDELLLRIESLLGLPI
ncbi:MAG: hypothetical protein A3J74_09850 [Elusimicrobia bacterium RIFCSPHIGHO2_02_FULL_57_9]|nr:MAG: hypothetical protein A3J74_09850 [Elusimicrobia bacterium RIFCSPHIGHO2_02_FULL_57_9]